MFYYANVDKKFRMYKKAVLIFANPAHYCIKLVLKWGEREVRE